MKPILPVIPAVQTWAATTNYPAGSDNWSSTATKLPLPIAGYLTPRTGAGAQHVNKMWADQNAAHASEKSAVEALDGYVKLLELSNFGPAITVDYNGSDPGADLLEPIFDPYLGYDWVVCNTSYAYLPEGEGTAPVYAPAVNEYICGGRPFASGPTHAFIALATSAGGIGYRVTSSSSGTWSAFTSFGVFSLIGGTPPQHKASVHWSPVLGEFLIFLSLLQTGSVWGSYLYSYNPGTSTLTFRNSWLPTAVTTLGPCEAHFYSDSNTTLIAFENKRVTNITRIVAGPTATTPSVPVSNPTGYLGAQHSSKGLGRHADGNIYLCYSNANGGTTDLTEILKSTDNGANWSLHSTISPPADQRVLRFAVYNEAMILLSNDSIAVPWFEPIAGLHYTLDTVAAASWKKILHSMPRGNGLPAMAANPLGGIALTSGRKFKLSPPLGSPLVTMTGT